MSVHKKPRGGYIVRWREGDTNRQRTFDRHADAKTWDAEVRRRRQLGTLHELDAGRETLDLYVTGTWTPVHVASLAPKTREFYAGLYDRHVSPWLGSYPLRDLTPELIGRWQADRLAAGAPLDSTRKALTMLGGILQRAAEGRRIAYNPARLVRKAAPSARMEVRPLAPTAVEAIRGHLRPRDALVVSLLAYAGLRPQEARGLCWGHVQDRTLVVHAPKTRRHSIKPRTVRLLGPLKADLAAWRLVCGRPSDDKPVIPALSPHGDLLPGDWTEDGYKQWITRVWAKALEDAKLDYQRPYDLRHSFASLLLHEGRSVIYVARQLGHSASLTMNTYGHVIDELEDAPRISADDAIREARVRAPFAIDHLPATGESTNPQ